MRETAGHDDRWRESGDSFSGEGLPDTVSATATIAQLRTDALIRDALEPRFLGKWDFSTLVVCWGSTLGTVAEALRVLDYDDVALLHFTQAHPMHRCAGRYLRRAKRIIVVDHGAASQLSDLIVLNTGGNFDAETVDISGTHFTVDEVARRLRRRIHSLPD